MSIGGLTPAMPSVVHDAKVHERGVDSSQRASQLDASKESGATSGDRDADGRQAWQWNQQQRKQQDDQESKKIPDISGKTGTTLDLEG
ncbi:MAG: hypothetical protein FWG73_00945 [Planctomycetaceae bacterium]|nr:hypothetical protein [Planctomycetaceae bacterium]